MPAKNVSIDEYLSKRKDFVSSAGAVAKYAKSPSSWKDDARSARFVMSTEAPDRDMDIVIQAGIDLTEFNKNPQALLFHNSRCFPVGNWENVKTVSGGQKRTEGDLVFLPLGADPDADRAANHVKHGTLRTVSIGFIPKLVQRREESPNGAWPGYEILECELVECSLVPIPANPNAIVKSAAVDMKAPRDLIEEILDTWVKLPDGLIVPRAEYEKALKTVTGFKTISTSTKSEADQTDEPGMKDADPDDQIDPTGEPDETSDEDAGEDPPPTADGEKSIDRLFKRFTSAIEASVSRLLSLAPKEQPAPPAKADPEAIKKAIERHESAVKSANDRLS